MPLYEYYCPPCGTQFELLRPVSKMDEAATCPNGHTTNNRVLSIFAPIMKSTGVATATLPTRAGADACCLGDDAAGGCSCC